MRWWLLLILFAAALAWRKWRAGRQAGEAQRRIAALLANQVADSEAAADREISDNLDI